MRLVLSGLGEGLAQRAAHLVGVSHTTVANWRKQEQQRGGLVRAGRTLRWMRGGTTDMASPSRRRLVSSAMLNQYGRWRHLGQVFMVERMVWRNDGTLRQHKVSYDITSLSR